MTQKRENQGNYAWISTRKKFQSDGSLDNSKFKIVVRRDLQNTEMIGETCFPTPSMSTLKCLLSYDSKYKEMLHQLDFIGSFI